VCRVPCALSFIFYFLFFIFYFLFFIYFFLTCSHKGRGRGIRSCDLHFIKRGSQPIELPLGDTLSFICIDDFHFFLNLKLALVFFQEKNKNHI
jgi:hypothetical protein